MLDTIVDIVGIVVRCINIVVNIIRIKQSTRILKHKKSNRPTKELLFLFVTINQGEPFARVTPFLFMPILYNLCFIFVNTTIFPLQITYHVVFEFRILRPLSVFLPIRHFALLFCNIAR